MYAATITKPQGGQSCNIFWPFEEEDNDMENETNLSSTEEIHPAADPKPHVLNGQTAFTFYSFVLGFAVPLLLILVFYVQVRYFFNVSLSI